jgi:Uma2 family endonuclease
METMVTALDPPIRRRRFTVDDVHRMVEVGILDEDEAVELLAGELVEVNPQGPAHAWCRRTLARRLRAACAGRVLVLERDPLECGSHSLPEPDVAVIAGDEASFRERHPRGDEASLVVEVARTSQRVDRDKAAIYAAAGVPEYWLVDLVMRTATIHRERTTQGYARIEVLDESAALPLPDGTTILLRELLP